MNNLPANARLLTKRDYSDVFDKAKKVEQNQLFALFRKNDNSVARIGTIISKKSCAKASQRNRIKRLIKESFRLRNLSSFDVIIISRKGVNELSNPQIFYKLSKIWEKLEAI